MLARYAIEHILDPSEFITNIAKVLRSGGLVEIETPNVFSREQRCHAKVTAVIYRIMREGNPDMPPLAAIRHALVKSMSGVNPPKHLWGFTAQGLGLLLERSGFEILKVRQATAGHRVFDPLYYDFHRLASRKGLGIPYFFWERITSILMSGRGTNLAVLAPSTVMNQTLLT